MWGNRVKVLSRYEREVAEKKEAVDIARRLALDKETFDRLRYEIDHIANFTVYFQDLIRRNTARGRTPVSTELLDQDITNLASQVDVPLLKKYIYSYLYPALVKEIKDFETNYIQGGDINRFFKYLK
jgi:hypothetical protein